MQRPPPIARANEPAQAAGSVCLYVQRCTGVPLAPEFGWLHADECIRAAGFRNPVARNEFITGRRLVRLAVATVLDVEPPKVDLVISSLGKPGLARDPTPGGCHFSIAHSHGLVLCALSRGHRVGADNQEAAR